jgi:hypothetical protein
VTTGAAAPYVAAVGLAALVLFTSPGTVPAFRETQAFAGLAFTAIYLTLGAGVVGVGGATRRALGISVFGFALLHAYFGFYRFVGGFEGLHYWSRYFAWSLAAGLLALVLLGVATVAARMRRLVYPAAILVLVHAVTVTIHLVQLRTILVATYALVVPLIWAEVVRLDRWAVRRVPGLPRHAFAAVAAPAASAILFWAFFVLGHHEH